MPGHYLGPYEDFERNSGRRYVYFGAFPPEDKRNVIAGRGKTEANSVVRFQPEALRYERTHWYVSQNGIILAAERVDELYIDYAYKRLDATESATGSGVTLATGSEGVQEVIFYHHALTYVALKGFSGSFLGDGSSQTLESAA